MMVAFTEPDDPDIPHWTITPEPTDEELVALMTAFSLVLAAPNPAPVPAAPVSHWSRVGRRAALSSAAISRGWGRPAGNAGWR